MALPNLERVISGSEPPLPPILLLLITDPSSSKSCVNALIPVIWKSPLYWYSTGNLV